MLESDFLIALAVVIIGRRLLAVIKKKCRRYKKMKKFRYGFDATKQERNTINRQISRMEKRGYIFPENIRAKIKTTKGLPDFLYEHSVFQPFIKGGDKRVRWDIPGTEGKELEKAIAKVNRENKRLYEKGLLVKPVVVFPSGISAPGPFTPSFFSKSATTIREEAREAAKKFIERAKEPAEKKLVARLEKDKRYLVGRIASIFDTYMTTMTDMTKREWLKKRIVREFDEMTTKDWLNFVRTTRFDIDEWFDSKTEDGKIAANFRQLLKELSILETKTVDIILDDLEDAMAMHSTVA